MEKYFSKIRIPKVVEEGGSATANVGDTSEKHARIELIDDEIVVDPGLRKPIHEYTPQDRDEVRRKYILHGPCQPRGHDFPSIQFGKTNRKFQPHWYNDFPWLEYSVAKDAAFCFYCYLFRGDVGIKYGDEVYTKKGFSNWKNALLKFREYVDDVGSSHNNAQTQFFSYKDQRQSIVHSLSSARSKIDDSYRTRLTASLNVVRLLLRNGHPFRGHDESESSLYKGNFLETLEWYGKLCPDVGKEILKNAPGNNQLISPEIQRDLVNACGEETRLTILKDIGDRVFSLFIDEARDCSVKEQMAFVLRYVNKFGEVEERFMGVVHVSNTSANTLKNAVDSFLTRCGLSMSKIRGQGYDGASNMRGELNGLKTLILNENHSAWYVHCFAHQLQLVIVGVAHEVFSVAQFFDYVSMIVNHVRVSCKCRDALKEMKYQLELERIKKRV